MKIEGDQVSLIEPRVHRMNIPLGTAGWQTLSDGAVRPFMSGDLLLGARDNRPIGSFDDRHALLICGARGGKGVSLLVPNMSLWPGSMLVLDPKGENATVTARRRAGGSQYSEGMGQKVYILDPFNEAGSAQDDLRDLKAAFNPLDLVIAAGSEAVDYASRIAEAIVVTESSNDPFWEESARMLIKGLILHVASSHNFLPHERNLATVRRLVMEGDTEAKRLAELSGENSSASDFQRLATSMRKNSSFGGSVREAGAAFEDVCRSDKTRVGVTQVARTNLDFIQSPGMQACLSRSDFALSELKTNSQGVSLFLCLPQRFGETHFRWLRMIATLFIGEMERMKSAPATGFPILAVMDEFPALKRMKVIENAAAQIASAGVKFVFVAQTLAQLKEIYKDAWETFVSNSGTKVFFGNDDHFTREYVSKLIGEHEVTRETQSGNRTLSETRSFGTSSGSSGGSSMSANGGSSTSGWSSQSTSGNSYGDSHSFGWSESVQKRPLLTPDEVGRMFGDRNRPAALALISGHQPLGLTRMVYYREEWLAGTFEPHPDPRHPLPRTLQKVLADREQRRRDELKRRKEEEEQARLAEYQRLAEEKARALKEKEDREKFWRDLRHNAVKNWYWGVAAIFGLIILYGFVNTVFFPECHETNNGITISNRC